MGMTIVLTVVPITAKQRVDRYANRLKQKDKRLLDLNITGIPNTHNHEAKHHPNRLKHEANVKQDNHLNRYPDHIKRQANHRFYLCIRESDG
jgi:septation ring formation regulator EzrA